MWHRDELDKKVIDRILKSSEDELKTMEAMLKAPMPKTSGGMMLESFLDETKLRIGRLKRWQELQSWLGEAGLISAEVLADGNCAVWALLSLEQKNPFLNSWDNLQKVDAKRSEIATSLRSASESVSYQTMYEALYRMDVVEVDDDDHAAPKAEPPSPKRRMKPEPTIFLDLTSPPKKSRKSSEVFAEGAQHGSSSSHKQKLADPVFQQPETEEGAPESKEKDQQRRMRFAAAGVALKRKRKTRQLLKKGNKKQPVSKKKSKKKKQKKGVEEGDEEEKKKRQRTCKTKERTESDKRIRAVRIYLAIIGVTYLSSQAFHGSFSHATLPKCTNYRAMFQELLEGDKPTCEVCAKMLKDKGFNREDMMKMVDAATDASQVSPMSQAFNTLRKRLEGGELQHVEEPEEIKTSDDVSILIHKYGQAPFMKALELGSEGRRVPIRCLACRTKKQPEGKIFEGSSLNKAVIKHFLRQHCGGDEHLGRCLEMAKKKQQWDATPVKLQGGTDRVWKDRVPMCVYMCQFQRMLLPLKDYVGLDPDSYMILLLYLYK